MNCFTYWQSKVLFRCGEPFVMMNMPPALPLDAWGRIADTVDIVG